MSYEIIWTPQFNRAAKQYVKRSRAASANLQIALQQLSQDPFHPRLKTHRLKGVLKGSWASSAGYDLRIIFHFISHGEGDAIILETVGTHDEVY